MPGNLEMYVAWHVGFFWFVLLSGDGVTTYYYIPSLMLPEGGGFTTADLLVGGVHRVCTASGRRCKQRQHTYLGGYGILDMGYGGRGSYFGVLDGKAGFERWWWWWWLWR
ncbi:hypothetical protein BZA05DRAFT_384795 [Tricharina praecox]|uniref:uncharacterized protein n=1 Tax=Tricharina praecox TaxID=43433 RepID=UPI00221E4A17|nr:uncharacterized protein BZA05DRAFT_384795 [Tricharina praecox]KAI5857785.1 hypothetical protein BZA05DRAFT_384795 [Tricharina praecox]